jgi:uncharacterized protein
MSDFLSAVILLLIGIASGIMNVFAGGGSSLTLPALIFLGLDTTVANGTNRIAIIFQNISAVYAFRKENYHEFPLSFKFSLITLPGAVVGALVALRIEDALFEKILGIIMIAIVITMIVPQKKIKVIEGDKLTLPVFLLLLFIGFYGGFIQVGVGFLIMAALHYMMRMNLVRVNMHKVFIILIFIIPTFFIFLIDGKINFFWGIVLAAGNALGAWWAAKYSVKKGEKVIRMFMIAAVLIMAAKLLNLF